VIAGAVIAAAAAAVPLYAWLRPRAADRPPVPIGDPLLQEVDCPDGTRGGCFIVPSPEQGARRASSERARACLESRVRSPQRLAGSELQKLTDELVRACFSPAGTDQQDEESGALPFRYAIHEPSGLPLELSYHCSDLCPNQGHVRAHFADIALSVCRQRGGTPDIYNGFGVYEGCTPPELVRR